MSRAQRLDVPHDLSPLREKFLKALKSSAKDACTLSAEADKAFRKEKTFLKKSRAARNLNLHEDAVSVLEMVQREVTDGGGSNRGIGSVNFSDEIEAIDERMDYCEEFVPAGGDGESSSEDEGV
uniref:Uncharacterized protein n=1 Tax=Octactis speculum TaxID=3111310 RepID=A0A7S2D498_9STRA|mmetsp:Transcript_43265/g.59142  ORF Transcript_43265/g.59142 Transcript_43265/m.59142 type:complete len:124 (+) Transcript_43265:91-462(+)